ncbi:MAG: hypothetical protein ACR2MB_03830 [Acidimicrobiales bacterium]
MTDRTDVEPAEIDLSMPARAPYARVARLAVAALASRLGYTYDDIEDLRIGVGEAFSLLVDEDHGEVGRIGLRCEIDGGAMAIELWRADHHPTSPVTDLSHRILAAVVDEARVDTERAGVFLTKRQEV